MNRSCWNGTCAARSACTCKQHALAYRRGRAWHQALTDLGATARFTRRYRPQTNGKAERFNRTLLDEWAYAQPFRPARSFRPKTTLRTEG
ncbi:transposase [Micromonospora sp. ATCC 39149]|nr:transposase [Micromonospora sp. ATCC 39149]